MGRKNEIEVTTTITIPISKEMLLGIEELHRLEIERLRRLEIEREAEEYTEDSHRLSRSRKSGGKVD